MTHVTFDVRQTVLPEIQVFCFSTVNAPLFPFCIARHTQQLTVFSVFSVLHCECILKPCLESGCSMDLVVLFAFAEEVTSRR